MAEEMLALLYAALSSPHGLVVRGDSFVKMSRGAYATRARANDPALKELSFQRSPDDPEREMWIVKCPRKSPNP